MSDRNGQPVQVVVVDDHAIVRDGLAAGRSNDAIARGRLKAQKVGGTYVVRLEDVRAYRESADQRPAPGRSPRAFRPSGGIDVPTWARTRRSGEHSPRWARRPSQRSAEARPDSGR